MIDIKEVRDISLIPVSSFLFVTLTLIFSLYFTTVIKTTPCDKDLKSVFVSNFIHTDPLHLIYNLYAIFAASRVEQEIGWKKFLVLIVFALTVNSIMEVILHKMFITIPCSIGFSGVLYTMFTWEIITKQKFDIYMLVAILSRIVYPETQGGKKVSVVGHLVGAVTGIFCGIAWNYIYPTLPDSLDVQPGDL